MRRAQSMSFDAIAATFLFVLIAVFGAVYAFNFFTADVGVSLTNDANSIGELLIRDLSASADGSDRVRVDERRLLSLVERSREGGGYDQIRGEFSVGSEFCVFIEDENGNIAVIVVEGDGGPQVERAHFGSSEVSFSTTDENGITTSIPCG